MIVNLASDIPFIFKDWKISFFDRQKLQIELPNYLYEIKNFKNIYVITWPWNFSTSRIWIEVLNILLYFWKIDFIYYLDKLDFFNQLWYSYIYLFSWNKNKLIKLKENKTYDIVFIDNIEDFYCEETFEDRNKISLKTIKYKDIFKDYKKLNWNKETNILKPYYIFEPIFS